MARTIAASRQLEAPIRFTTGGSDLTLTNTTGVVLVTSSESSVKTINLPTAVGNGAIFIITKMPGAATSLVIDASGSQTIVGDLTISLTQDYESVTLISDNSNWIIR